MSPLHLAFFHFDVRLRPGEAQGGAERALEATARALAARGHRVTVLGRLAADVARDGVEWLTAGAPDAWDVEAGLARLAGCDVLVSTLRADVLESAAGRPGIRRRVLWPHVASADAVGVPVARLVEVADRIVAVSHDQGDVFAAAGVPRDRIAVVPNGVDLHVFRPDPGVARVPGRVVFAGALVPDKGLDVLLHAMPLVRALVPGAELVVCGSASLWGRERYFDPEAVAREQPYVRFRGALAPAALADELRTAALAVVPTPPARWRESCGLASLEAQACGTPVVVVRNGGLPETVADGGTGWVVDEATPPMLAAAIVGALRTPERLRAMGESAATRMQARSWARNAEAWEALALEPPAARAPAARVPAARPVVGMVTTWRQRCGLARYAEALVAALPAGRVQVLAEETGAVLPGPAPAVPVARVWRRGAGLDALVDDCTARGVRLVHVNHHGGLFGARVSALLEALGARGIRTVVTMHAPNQRDPEIAAIGALADAIVVHGEGMRLEVIANGVAPDVLRVVPMGCPPLATGDAGAIRTRIGLPDGEKLVVSVGFLQPHKGFHEVVRALPALRARYPVQYLILGGPLPDDPAGAAYRDALLAEAERLGVRDAVTLVEEHVPDAVLADCLRAADAIALPYQTTWWEGSAAVRDALASGRPVVASPALAFAELGAAVFRTSAAFPLADALDAVLTNPALAGALVAEATQLVARAGWPHVASRYDALYEEILERPTRRLDEPETPHVVFMLREHASRTGGGDWEVARTLARGVADGGVRVVCREGGRVPAGAPLVHLFNFSTYVATHEHARRALELGVPFVVSAMYEDWPAFKVAAEEMLQRMRARLGLPPTVDLEAYARLHAGEQRDLLARMQLVAEHARCVVATGASEEARLRRDFPGIRTRRIALGVAGPGDGDADAFRARWGTRDFVLCVGRIEPRKNQLALLEALADDPADVVFATGGHVYRTDYLEACQAFRRRGRTLYLPRLEPHELAGAYRAARVHVLPSWFELPGLVTLEALAAGCAVVASDRGTLRDHLGDGIPYAAPDDPAGLARAVAAADGWNFGAARARAAATTPDATAAAWAAVYEAALADVAAAEVAWGA